MCPRRIAPQTENPIRMLKHLALAYLDPGTGSLIVQTMIAAVLGALLVFKGYWRQLIHRMRFGSTSEESTPADPTDERTP